MEAVLALTPVVLKLGRNPGFLGGDHAYIPKLNRHAPNRSGDARLPGPA